MSYDQLICIPNVSPIDVIAILKQKQRGEIKGTFQLKNSPGISYYGYKNVLDYIGFNTNKDKLDALAENYMPTTILNDPYLMMKLIKIDTGLMARIGDALKKKQKFYEKSYEIYQ